MKALQFLGPMIDFLEFQLIIPNYFETY